MEEALAHAEDNQLQIVRGWIQQAGPTSLSEDHYQMVSRITSLARTHGFEEPPPFGELLHLWERAYVRWQSIRKAARKVPMGRQRVGSAGRHRDFQTGRSRGGPLSGSPPPALPQFELFTDGACLGDTKTGGWAYLLGRIGTGLSDRRQSSGACPQTTNNRMELTAVIMGLELLDKPAQVRIVTDSIYLRKGMVDWLPRWRDQGWRAGSGRRLRPLANVDLWQRLAAQMDRHRVSVRWIPSHAGHPENDYCDQLARRAAGLLAQLEATGEVKQSRRGSPSGDFGSPLLSAPHLTLAAARQTQYNE